MNLRQKVYHGYMEMLYTKIELLQQQIAELKEGLQSETKSTAGDKYETGRAMIHIEQENLGRQLSTIREQQTALEHIDIERYTGKIIAGSLVRTNKGYLFPGVALGKLLVDGIPVFALSPAAPLGLQLMGLGVGGRATINKEEYTIEEIL
jgi:hypothetical protein